MVKIISIGIDCGIADYLKKNNLRNVSLPFDWCVTYDGVANIIKNNFNSFLPIDNSNFSKETSTLFVHNSFPNDYDKMRRRIERFKDILKSTDEEIIFFRKGHSQHNHLEEIKYNCIIKDEIKDAEELNIFLKENYPELKFKIIIALFCTKCFNLNEVYKSCYNNILIYNLFTDGINFDTKKIDDILTEIL